MPVAPLQMESAFQLYSATSDPQYLHFARDAMLQLLRHNKADCGFASVADVNTGRLDDRMDSYFLAETLKYLYLLFDEVCSGRRNEWAGQIKVLRVPYERTMELDGVICLRSLPPS